MPDTAKDKTTMYPETKDTVIELLVRDHPGAMSHITGLFARRAFNLDAIVCVPSGDGATSRMLLRVGDGPRLDQVGRQLARLHDVLEVRQRPDLGAEHFEGLIPIRAQDEPVV